MYHLIDSFTVALRYYGQSSTWSFHISGFNLPQIESIQEKKKIPDSSKEQNLNLLTMGNYLESTLHHIYNCIRYCK